MTKSIQNICTSLPFTVTNQINTFEDRQQYLLNFLENTLPSSDTKSIADELRKSLTFSRHKMKNAPKKRKKGKFLTARKRSLLGLNKIGKESNLKYHELLPLNKLWLDYMQQMLGVRAFTDLPTSPTDANWDTISQQLRKADFHGAMVSVVRSKCPSLVGIHGIVLQDTRGTFRILGEDNILRTIPKETVLFKIYLNDVTLQLFGREFCTKPAERSVKKCKTAHMPTL